MLSRFRSRISVTVQECFSRISDHQIVYYRSRRLACYHVDRYQEHVSSQIGKSRVSRKNSLCRARKNTLTHVHFAPGKIDKLFQLLVYMRSSGHFLLCLRMTFTRTLLFMQLFSKQRKDQLMTFRHVVL